jgi:hypothetical protein
MVDSESVPGRFLALQRQRLAGECNVMTMPVAEGCNIITMLNDGYGEHGCQRAAVRRSRQCNILTMPSARVSHRLPWAALRRERKSFCPYRRREIELER